uniref:Short-chain dehydrogenase n=1 Tax=Bursaphelenchus xylophilus TaxID=6326 RepID=A0A1I7SVH7_BURXY
MVQNSENQVLRGQVALVTGASRGCGRGIAKELGRAGCIVYITALRMEDEDPMIQAVREKLPTLESVAKEIEDLGGKAIPIYCNHDNSDETAAVFDQIKREQDGHLDILVNNAFAGVPYMLKYMHTKFFDLPEDIYDTLNNAGLKGHYWCARHAAKMMIQKGKGFIVNISSFGGINYTFNVAYGVGKAGLDRMASDIAWELKEFNIPCISFYPAPNRTELFSKEVGLIKRQSVIDAYAEAESPEFSGKCIVKLATDPNLMKKTGMIINSIQCGKEYGIKDIDGSKLMQN